jgi:hypothetical protein
MAIVPLSPSRRNPQILQVDGAGSSFDVTESSGSESHEISLIASLTAYRITEEVRVLRCEYHRNPCGTGSSSRDCGQCQGFSVQPGTEHHCRFRSINPAQSFKQIYAKVILQNTQSSTDESSTIVSRLSGDTSTSMRLLYIPTTIER